MTFDLSSLLRLAWHTVRAPRDGAKVIRGVEMSRAARWEALLLVVVISVILGQLTAFLVLGTPGLMMGPLLANPIMAGIIQMSMLVIMVFAIYWVGRALGGTGGFGDTILLVAWMQFVMVCLQVVQTLAMIVMPPLASLIGIGGLVLFFWLLTSFIAELHGFQSLGKVFGMVILSLVGIAFGLSLILTMIGITVPGAP